MDQKKQLELDFSEDVTKYMHQDLPVTMSAKGLDTLVKTWLAQTGTSPVVLEQFYINGKGDIGTRLVTTILATALASLIASEESEAEVGDKD
jgi:hypothetical protein